MNPFSRLFRRFGDKPSPASPPPAPQAAPAPPAPPPAPPKLAPAMPQTTLPLKYDVFISYSHADRDQAVLLETDLKKSGLEVWRDDRLNDAAETGFLDSINEAHHLAGRVLVLWSDPSVKSHWVKEEAEAARNAGKIVCLALAPFESLEIPIGFRTLPTLALNEVAKDPGLLLRALGAAEDAGRPGCFTLVKPDLDTEHLPQTFASILYGRDEELHRLTAAWDSGKVNVFAMDAIGGAGKTALTVHFVNGLQTSGWRGARAVFAWSFYSQGSNEDRQSDSAAFFQRAFGFFAKGPSEEWQNRQAQARSQGMEEPVWPPKDERDKGAELARHIQARRALLILDGLEPLQYAAGATGGAQTLVVGGIKDPAVKTLLEALVKHNPGLCIVSTRIELREFRGRAGFVAEALDKLDSVSGMRLLRGLGVEGEYPSAQYVAWAKAFGEDKRFSLDGDAEPAKTWHLPTYAGFQERLPIELQSSHVPADYQFPKDLQRELDRVDRSAGDTFPVALAFKLLTTVTRFEGHALSLTLIANYLRTYHEGKIEAVDDVPLLEMYAGNERHPYSVMRGIEIALAKLLADPERNPHQHPGETDAGRRLAILLFLGFFDRPAPTSLLSVVFPRIQPVLDPAQDPPVEIEGLEKLYRKPGETGEEWKERARRMETERRALFRSLFPWTSGYSEHQLSHILGQLAQQGLVHKGHKGESWDQTEIDCHPLVREYFSQRLRKLDPRTFEAAHGRLYDHYRFRGLPEEFRDPVAYGVLALRAAYDGDHYPMLRKGFLDGSLSEGLRDQCPPSIGVRRPDELRGAFALVDSERFQTTLPKFLPEDSAGMEPLFAAIGHGCLARRHDECFNEVYWPRVARGNVQFAAHKLGLHGQNLAALASFFDLPFHAPSSRFHASRQALVLNMAGYALRALGRLPDAVAPMRAGAERRVVEQNWRGAAIISGNLSELLVTLGRLEDSAEGEAGAVATAARAVAFADQSGDAEIQEDSATAVGQALLERGFLTKAEDAFKDGERIHKRRQPSHPRLYSLSGFLYGELLLARGRVREVEERERYTTDAYDRYNAGTLMDRALSHLNQARAQSISAFSFQLSAFSSVLSALQKANNEDELPRGYLAIAECGLRNAELYRNEIAEALTEAETIATRGPMPLFLAEANLLAARTALALGYPELVKEHREKAAELIAKHHFGRREPDLAVLDAEIAVSRRDAEAQRLFEQACQAVGGEGWWHLLPRLEALGKNFPGAESQLQPLRDAEAAYNRERDAYLAEQAAAQPESEPDEGGGGMEIPAELIAVVLDQLPAEVLQQIAQQTGLATDWHQWPKDFQGQVVKAFIQAQQGGGAG